MDRSVRNDTDTTAALIAHPVLGIVQIRTLIGELQNLQACRIEHDTITEGSLFSFRHIDPAAPHLGQPRRAAIGSSRPVRP